MALRRLRAIWMALGALGINAAGAAQNQVTWSDYIAFTPGFTATGVKIADVAGSPLPDIVMSNGAGNLLRILDNQGPGQIPVATDLAVGANPGEIATADLDGDGDQDLVTRNASTISVLIRQPGGSYVRTDYPLAGPGRLGIADVDVNGLPDVVRGSHAVLATARASSGR